MKTRKRNLLINGDKVFMGISYVALALVFVLTLYPMIFVLSASFSDPGAVSSGEMVLFPKEFTLEGYRYILKYNEIWLGYANTIFYTLVGTFINLAVTLPAAYALSRKELVGRNLILFLFMFTMYFSGGLIPSYLNANSFGLVNTRTFVLINGAVSVYNLIVARTFFSSTIPEQLHEAARIDGADMFKDFFKIVLPLSKPVIVVLALYYGVGHWNEYFTSMIYLAKRREAWPLQLFLKEILIQGQFAESALMAGGLSTEEIAYLFKQADTANMVKYGVIVVSVVPMLAIYPWLQKYFAQGVMLGAVKE